MKYLLRRADQEPSQRSGRRPRARRRAMRRWRDIWRAVARCDRAARPSEVAGRARWRRAGSSAKLPIGDTAARGSMRASAVAVAMSLRAGRSTCCTTIDRDDARPADAVADASADIAHAGDRRSSARRRRSAARRAGGAGIGELGRWLSAAISGRIGGRPAPRRQGRRRACRRRAMPRRHAAIGSRRAQRRQRWLVVVRPDWAITDGEGRRACGAKLSTARPCWMSNTAGLPPVMRRSSTYRQLGRRGGDRRSRRSQH